MATCTLPERKGLTGKLSAVLVLLGISVFLNYIDRGNLSIAAPMLKDELANFGIATGRSSLGVLLDLCVFAACIWLAGRPLERQLGHRRRILSLVCGDSRDRARAHIRDAVRVALDSRHRGVGRVPSYSKIIALNFPEEHRGLANSVISAGLVLGPGLGMLLGGTLMASSAGARSSSCSDWSACSGLSRGSSGCPGRETNSPGHDRRPESFRVPAIALRLGNLRWAVLRQLRELFPDHVAAFLPGSRATLLRWTRWRRSEGPRICWGPVSLCFRLAFRPLDHVRRNSHSSAQDIYWWRPSTCRDFPRAVCRQRANRLRSHARVGCDLFRRLQLPMSGQSHKRSRARKPRGDGQVSRISSAIWQGLWLRQSPDSSWTGPGTFTGLSRS